LTPLVKRSYELVAAKLPKSARAKLTLPKR